MRIATLFFSFTLLFSLSASAFDTVSSQNNPVNFRILKRDISPLPEDYKYIKSRLSAKKTRAIINYFQITYLSAGESDAYGEPCTTFPEEAKTVFEHAAQIWSSYITTTVPITIEACWADLSSYGNVLGYSASRMIYVDGTAYNMSLANAISEEDLDPSDYDSYITYNRDIPFYYGLDGNTPLNQSDLLTVVLHEMGHSLNFLGLAAYSSGTGSFSDETIFDRFAEDGNGTALLDYANPSTALGSALTSNNIYFNGTHANAANGNSRVKLYAPSTWYNGSSYSHLDYDTYKNTPNSLMVYKLTDGAAIHDPGDVTLGILEDMGWEMSIPASTSQPLNPSIIMYLLN